MADRPDVPRETPPVPTSARGVFGIRTPLAEAFAALLADDGVTRGLIGPREAPRIWDRHLLNCAVVTDLLRPGADVADLGSGAGLPGVVLAIRRPDLRVTLVEPLLRRTRFLTETVERLQLDNVEVLRARAEELHGHREFSVVTSRAVAPLPRLLDWSMPLVARGGWMVAMKGRSAATEVTEAAADLARWGAGTVEVTDVGPPMIEAPTTVVRVESTRPSQLHWRHSDREAGDLAARRSRGKGRRT